MNKTLIGIGILIITIIILFQINQPQVIVQKSDLNNKTFIENTKKQELQKPTISKAIEGEPKTRRCRFNNDKYRKSCTETQYNEWQAQMETERLYKQKNEQEKSLAKLYLPDEYLDYENKIIQPYTIIDENKVGWDKNNAKERKHKKFTINNYDSVYFNTKKFMHNIKENNINVVTIRKPNSDIVWNYTFKDIKEEYIGKKIIYYIHFNDESVLGGRLNLVYYPHLDTLEGIFTNMGNIHFVEIHNNKGYTYNDFK